MARKLKRRAIFQVVHYIQSPQIGVSFLPSRSQAKDLSSRDLGLFGMILSETKTMKAQGFHAGLLFSRCFSRFLPSFCLPNHTRGQCDSTHRQPPLTANLGCPLGRAKILQTCFGRSSLFAEHEQAHTNASQLLECLFSKRPAQVCMNHECQECGN